MEDAGWALDVLYGIAFGWCVVESSLHSVGCCSKLMMSLRGE